MPTGTARHVLIVDDAPDLARLMGLLVRGQGCTCDVAHDGAAALAMARATRPDLALLDISMPDMDGYELARRLRSESLLDPAGLIAVTGHPLDGESLAAAGFSRAFQKPLDFATIEAMLQC